MSIKRNILGLCVAGATIITAVAAGPVNAALIHQTCDGQTLCTVDISTGATSTIGPFEFDNTYGIAFDLDGTMYATLGSGMLGSVDLSTGAGTSLGLLPSLTDAIDFDSRGNLYGLATDGTLYNLDKSNVGRRDRQ